MYLFQISTTVPLILVKMGVHVLMVLDPMRVAVLPGTKAISVRSVSHMELKHDMVKTIFVYTYFLN